MVKPPKSMQPESVDLSKAGRKSGRAFQMDSFHQYMARKIDLQRKQFGVILPPPPVPTAAAQPSERASSPVSPQSSTKSSPNNRRKRSPSKRPRPQKSVSFAALPLKRPREFPLRDMKRGKLKKRITTHFDEEELIRDNRNDKDNGVNTPRGSIGAILQNLQRRHGRGQRRNYRCIDRKRSHHETSRGTFEDSPRDVGNHEITASTSAYRSTTGRHDTIPSAIIETDHISQEGGGLAVESASVVLSSASSTSPSRLRRQRPDLFFLGIVVKVNGYTDPDNESLKRMLQMHGGDLETYETNRVTHIVAEQMSAAKAKYMQKQRRPLPVVRPSWIVESVEAGRLLNQGDYLLDTLKNDPANSNNKAQRSIQCIFGKAVPSEGKQHQGQGARRPGESSTLVQPPLFLSKEAASANQNSVEGRIPLSSTRINSLTSMIGTIESLDLSQEAEIAKAATSLLLTNSTQELMEGQNGHTLNKKPTTAAVVKDSLQSKCNKPSKPIIKTADNVGKTNSGLASPHHTNNDVGFDDDFHSDIPKDRLVRKLPQRKGEGCAMQPSLLAHADCETRCDPFEAPKTSQVKSPSQGPTMHGRTDAKYINGKIRTTGTDPNFLDSFFANSRLSFIGSYKQRTNEAVDTNPSHKLLAVAGEESNFADKHRFVFHIDMDCFFANVVLRNFPQYKDKPVVISHHGKSKEQESIQHHDGNLEIPISGNSTSECATCNYHARKFGIKKGMFLGRARQLCPELVILQYDFAGYEEVSDQVLGILHRMSSEHGGCVEPVSCDEAYVELYLTGNCDDMGASIEEKSPYTRAGEIAEMMRKEILEKTQCTASIGVAQNKFLAKIGTDRVKPNGTFVVKDFRVVLKNLRLRDLHGIGYRSEPKLSAEGLDNIQDIWDLGTRAENILCRVLGPGLGKKIHGFCQGQDDRKVKASERKTIGAECNYGVRFDGPYGIDHFISGLSREVEKRMEGVGVKGCKITLKVKQRKKGAKAPPKFLGHGSCHNLSKSVDVPGMVPTRDSTVFASICLTLFRELAVPLEDVRGVGIVVSKLCTESSVTPIRTALTPAISKWLAKVAKPNSLNQCKMESEISVRDMECRQGVAIDRNCVSKECKKRRHLDDTNSEETNESAKIGRAVAAKDRLALPPLSQICMSQVAALPSEMQDEIHSLLKLNREECGLDLRDIATDEKASSRISKTDELVQSALLCNETNHFRQTNLKRMMKLAAVKAGQEDTNLALSQLELLPLEIKLQIVNGDADALGKLSQKSHYIPSLEKQIMPAKAAEEHLLDSHNVKVRDLARQREKDFPQEIVEHGELVEPRSTFDAGLQLDLFEDDILPLQHFLDENSPLDPEAIDMVVLFLRTCLREKRMSTLLILLRSIRNRKDQWSEEVVLSDIEYALEEDHASMYGFGLNMSGTLKNQQVEMAHLKMNFD